jgi:multiple sugar transport system substrate-binding protein
VRITGRFVRRMAAVLASTALLCACTGIGGGHTRDELVVWTTEDNGPRVVQQQQIADRFTQATGVKVKIVAVAVDQLTPVLTSAAAANELPDAIGSLSLDTVNQLASDELLDVNAAKAVVSDLGPSTFSQRSLELTSRGDERLAVPSDAFADLLFYRKDLFAQAGLGVPDTFDAIETAAKTLNRDGVAGIVAATGPSDSFTQQTFEQFALANGCQLLQGETLTLNSPQCVRAIEFYGDLMKNYSIAGTQDADITRATYFAGKAGMLVWSSFLLDELAGLRDDALPTCPQCENDKRYLAENTGVVSAFKGPDGPRPAAWGDIVSWVMLRDSKPRVRDFVKFMMSDGYEDWLQIAPEGKVPVRVGTLEDPRRYADLWKTFTIGVDTKAKLTDVYGPAVLESVATSPDRFSRWGSGGQGELAAVIAGQFIVPQALADVINSGTSASQAAEDANDEATSIQEDLK